MIRAALLLLVLAAVPVASRAIEEPPYELIGKVEDVEIRRYASYVIAEVVVDADVEAAGGQGFPILASYIFGRNKEKKSLEMTAPVIQRAAPVPLETGAPITQTAVPGGMQVQFVLPRGLTTDSAPEPLDPRIHLRSVAGGDWAVLRYSGTWSAANYQEHLDRLRATLAAGGIQTRGEPVLARYDAPFMPWFLRRNEVWLAVP